MKGEMSHETEQSQDPQRSDPWIHCQLFLILELQKALFPFSQQCFQNEVVEWKAEQAWLLPANFECQGRKRLWGGKNPSCWSRPGFGQDPSHYRPQSWISNGQCQREFSKAHCLFENPQEPYQVPPGPLTHQIFGHPLEDAQDRLFQKNDMPSETKLNRR